MDARGAQNTKNTQKFEFFDLDAISRQIFRLGQLPRTRSRQGLAKGPNFRLDMKPYFG